MRRLLRAAAGLAAALLLAAPAAGAERIVSLDQCADQFVLALADPADIAALSRRADDPDAYLAAQARGHPLRRTTLESLLAARPTIAIRYWGGDPRLVRALERRGVRVLTLDEASDFAGVRRNVRAAGATLRQPARAESLVRRMDVQLVTARGAGRGRPTVYLTSGGYVAGPNTLIDAMIRAAGFTNPVRTPYFSPAPLERLVLAPPAAVILGFFETALAGGQQWSPGRHAVVRRLIASRPATRLPSTVLACPAWFAADGVTALAAARRDR